MAISPLALGIGLQGKYDYKRQTMLDLARERGRAKAEAAEAEAKAKKRAPYERALMKVDTSGLLPYQAKLIKEKYADALQSFEDAPDDYSLHATNMQDINSSSKAFRDQAENYKRLSMTRDRMPADEEALTIIGTLSDPKAIQEALGKLGPASSVQFANDQFLFSNPKYQGIGDSITKFVKSSMFDPEQGVNEFTIGDRKYGGADINTQVPGIITDNIMRTDNLRQSAINDYLQYAQTNNIPYDFSTKESTNEFLNNTTKYVNDSAKKYIDALSKTYGGSKTQFTNINNNITGGAISDVINWSEGNKYQFGEEGIPDAYIISEGGALPVTENKTVVLANNDAIWDVESGERITAPDVTNGTYNEPALVYKAKETYKFPETQIKMQDGSMRTLPARTFQKNEPLRGGYAYAMAQKGKAKAGYVAFGIIKNSKNVETKVVRNLGDIGISEFIDASKYKQAQLNEIYKTAKKKKDDLQKKINSYYQAPSSSAPTPPPTPPKDIVEKKAVTPPTKEKPKSGEKPKKQPPKGTEDIFGELEIEQNSKGSYPRYVK
jgi:hypothetical protein